jgi:hypothetical protein
VDSVSQSKSTAANDSPNERVFRIIWFGYGMAVYKWDPVGCIGIAIAIDQLIDWPST